jgi:hypothetical protein
LSSQGSAAHEAMAACILQFASTSETSPERSKVPGEPHEAQEDGRPDETGGDHQFRKQHELFSTARHPATESGPGTQTGSRHMFSSGEQGKCRRGWSAQESSILLFCNEFPSGADIRWRRAECRTHPTEVHGIQPDLVDLQYHARVGILLRCAGAERRITSPEHCP